MFDQFLTMKFLSLFERKVTHRANDASNDGHRPPLCRCHTQQPPWAAEHVAVSGQLGNSCHALQSYCTLPSFQPTCQGKNEK